MKQLLLILALCPVLTFANETEFETLEEELAFEQQIEAQEKANHVRRMTELSAMIQEKEQAQEEIESEPWLIEKIYMWGLLVLGIPAILFCIAMTVESMWKSIRLNYHMFVEYGEFVFAKADSIERENARIEVAKKMKNFDVKDVNNYTWFTVLGMSFLASLVVMAGVVIWPISVIAFGPQALTGLLAWRKRKKKVFEKNLKGLKTDVPN